MMHRVQEIVAAGACGFFLLLLSVVCASAWAAEIPAELDAALQRYIDLPDALVPVLEAAHDKESAEKAAPDLQALLVRVSESRKEMMNFPSLSQEVAEAVRVKYEMKMRTRWGKVFDHIFRLQRVRCYECVPFFKHFNTLCVLLEK